MLISTKAPPLHSQTDQQFINRSTSASVIFRIVSLSYYSTIAYKYKC